MVWWLNWSRRLKYAFPHRLLTLRDSKTLLRLKISTTNIPL